MAEFDTQTSEATTSDTVGSSQTFLELSDSDKESTHNNEDNKISSLQDELTRIQEIIKRTEAVKEEKKRKQKEAQEARKKKEAEKEREAQNVRRQNIMNNIGK